MAKLILSDDIAYENLILLSDPKLAPGTETTDFFFNNCKQKSDTLLIFFVLIIDNMSGFEESYAIHERTRQKLEKRILLKNEFP